MSSILTRGRINHFLYIYLLEEHLLHAVHGDITQLRGQHGPVQD